MLYNINHTLVALLSLDSVGPHERRAGAGSNDAEDGRDDVHDHRPRLFGLDDLHHHVAHREPRRLHVLHRDAFALHRLRGDPQERGVLLVHLHRLLQGS